MGLAAPFTPAQQAAPQGIVGRVASQRITCGVAQKGMLRAES
jgi:hypothetical protein